MTQIGFDEEVSRQVEKLYLTPDVAAQRCEVLKLLELRRRAGSGYRLRARATGLRNGGGRWGRGAGFAP
jgi:hypothetical protein